MESVESEDVQNKEINWVEISSYHPIVFVIELLKAQKEMILIQ